MPKKKELAARVERLEAQVAMLSAQVAAAQQYHVCPQPTYPSPWQITCETTDAVGPVRIGGRG